MKIELQAAKDFLRDYQPNGLADVDVVVTILRRLVEANSPVDVLCVTDETGEEAIYFDGRLGYCDSTIYMAALVHAINSKRPVSISHRDVKDPEGYGDGWPDNATGLTFV